MSKKFDEVRKKVIQFLREQKEQGKFDSFHMHDIVREKFKLSRSQTADIMRDFKTYN